MLKKHKSGLLFLLLVAPVLILRLGTAGYPIAHTLHLSTTDYHLLDQTKNHIGLENYRDLWADEDFRFSLGFTLVFISVSTLLELSLGLVVALFLNARFKLRSLARGINLIPWAIPAIVAAYAFQWLLDDQFGMFSHAIHALTGTRPAPFNSASGAQVTLILVNVWKNAPFMAVIFLAGLQGIPEELYEAAKVDGAGRWQRFCRITLPMLTPLLITMGLYFVIWQLASFDLIFGLTRGGPGIATTVLSLKIYQEGLLFFKFGYASAICVILMLLVALLGIIGIVWFRRTSTE